jgi:RyR domain
VDYLPNPIDTSDVKLPPSLERLTELLAKNAHEIWARQRLADGWSYGSRRDDVQKQHPCLIPYEDLPESEKVYDRNAAIQTLKAILALHYRIAEPARGGQARGARRSARVARRPRRR